MRPSSVLSASSRRDPPASAAAFLDQSLLPVPPGEDRHIVPPRAQFFRHVAAQRARSACYRDFHAPVTTHPREV